MDGRATRQTEELIGSVLQLLGLDLPVPDHSTLSRRAETLAVPRPQAGSAPVHLLLDSTGLKLCGPGEWLIEKHGMRVRWSWRKLHIGVDADTGWFAAFPDLEICAPIPALCAGSVRHRDGARAALTLSGAPPG